jgi:hypothetical protein
MNSSPLFSIRYNPDIGYTLIYDDSHGRLMFVFEYGDDPKTVVLNRRPLTGDSKLVDIDNANRVRVELAFERTSDFLKSEGWNVEPYGSLI